MKRKVLIIYTGGTIGMEKDYDSGSLRAFDFNRIFKKIPEMHLLECEVFVEQFAQPLDSSDVGPEEWREMARMIRDHYDQYDGFLILHGTDTMAYTASALSFMLKNLQKPVILTGSQLPIGDLRTDAKENLLTSLYYASLYENEEAVVKEVALYFEYKLLRGNRSLKYSGEYFDAFISPNYPKLGESGVHLNVDKLNLKLGTDDQKFDIDEHLNESVVIFRIFPGLKMDYLLALPEVKVLILEVFGSGTIFSDKKTEEVLHEIKKRGTEIVVISQCVSGGITLGKYTNSNVFHKVGAISGGDITAESALAKSMHLIGNPNYSQDFRTLFRQNLCGEITE